MEPIRRVDPIRQVQPADSKPKVEVKATIECLCCYEGLYLFTARITTNSVRSALLLSWRIRLMKGIRISVALNNNVKRPLATRISRNISKLKSTFRTRI
jgi:hypothetical protein